MGIRRHSVLRDITRLIPLIKHFAIIIIQVAGEEVLHLQAVHRIEQYAEIIAA